MIKGLEKTCGKYPHIEEKLNSLKFQIQKYNYLKHLITENERKIDTKIPSSVSADWQGGKIRRGFDPEYYKEMMVYLNNMDTEVPAQEPVEAQFQFTIES